MRNNDAFFLRVLNTCKNVFVHRTGRLTPLIALRRFDRARSLPNIKINERMNPSK